MAPRGLAVAALLAACVAPALAHICLLHPLQRGPADISKPGEHDCKLRTAPCGGFKEGSLRRTYTAGQVYDINFQQNLNHYNPGDPGRIIFMLSTHAPVSSQKDFTILLWEGSDYWAHFQGTQTNFTVPVLIPAGVECEHCVVQIRYHPNKPTEPVFHQCADVKIEAPASERALKADGMNPEAMWPAGSLLVWGGFDVGHASLEFTTNLYNVIPGLNGKAELVTTGEQISGLYPVNGLAGYVASKKTAVWLAGKFSEYSTFTAPHTLVFLTGKSKWSTAQLSPVANGMLQWDAIIDGPSSEWPLIFIGRTGDTNTQYYQYHVFLANFALGDGDTTEVTLKKVGSMTPSTDLYVNFYWAVCATSPTGTHSVTVLSGNENDLYGLTAWMYTLTFNSQYKVLSNTQVSQNVTQFTISNLFADKAGNIFGVSPGDGNPVMGPFAGYSVVNINSTSGDVTEVSKIQTKPLRKYYGGGVYGKAFSNGDMVYVFEGTPGFQNLALFGRSTNYRAITLPIFFEEHKVFHYQLRLKSPLWVTDFE